MSQIRYLKMVAIQKRNKEVKIVSLYLISLTSNYPNFLNRANHTEETRLFFTQLGSAAQKLQLSTIEDVQG